MFGTFGRRSRTESGDERIKKKRRVTSTITTANEDEVMSVLRATAHEIIGEGVQGSLPVSEQKPTESAKYTEKSKVF